MPARYYQDEAVQAVGFSLSVNKSCVVNLPTGSGKTVVASYLIKDWLPDRTLYLADQDELCFQPLRAIERFVGVIPALDKSNQRASLNARIIVASSQTLAKENRLHRYPPGFFKRAIVDEAHRGAKRDKKITDYLGCQVVGITATAFLANMRDLSQYYDEVAYQLPMIDLISEGFAPPLLVETIPLEIDLGNVETSRGLDGKDYDLQSLATTIEPYYLKIAQIIKQKAAGRKIIIFLPLVQSSKDFAEICRQEGLSAHHVDGFSTDRKESMMAFAAGRFQCLCNSQLVETGVDIPEADCVVSLSPTHSRIKYQQRIGRICRVLPGIIDDYPEKDQSAIRRALIAKSAKPNALILDFLWQHDKLGTINPGHLFASNEADAQKMFEKIKIQRTPEDMERIAALILAEREAELVKQIEDASDRASEPVRPAIVGLLTKDRSLMNYEPASIKEAEPPSIGQIAKLTEWGIDASQINHKGQAHALMSIMIHRKRFRLASLHQLEALVALGVPHDPWKLTQRDASALLTQTKISKRIV